MGSEGNGWDGKGREGKGREMKGREGESVYAYSSYIYNTDICNVVTLFRETLHMTETSENNCISRGTGASVPQSV
jgi:hypothetical protein